MKTILCPTDLSPTANNAIMYAAELAKKTSANLLLLHVLPDYVYTSEFAADTMIDQMENEKDMTQKLENLAQTIEQDFDIDCQFQIETDRLVPAVNRIADTQADLVVMGTAGADSIESYLFGSQTYKVLEKSSKPLLMVPYGVSYQKINTLVFATDYHKDDSGIISNLHTFAEIFNCSVRVLHISQHDTPVSKEVFHAFKSEVEKQEILPDILEFEQITSDDIADSIDKYILSTDGAMLGLSVKHHNIFQKLFIPSISRKIALMAEYPVLVVHE